MMFVLFILQKIHVFDLYQRKIKKLKIDRRFASMFNDPKLKLKYTVDKRGRSLIREQTIRHDMNKFYHLEQNDSSTSSDEELSKKKN